MPHFFLSVMKNKPDAQADCEHGAVCPDLFIFGEKEVRFQVLMWTALYSMGILWYVLSGAAGSRLWETVTWLNAMLVLLPAGLLVVQDQLRHLVFSTINLSLLVFMGTVHGGRIFT